MSVRAELAEMIATLPAEALQQLLEQQSGAPVRALAEPTSFSQRRLWFLDQVHPGSAHYNMQSVLHLRGPLDHRALARALEELVARHEILRTRFNSEEGEPVQLIDPPFPVELPVRDLARLLPAERTAALELMIHELMWQPFNLATDRLLRPTLVRLAIDEHALVLSMHHIISDEWSFQILHRDLALAYSHATGSGNGEMPELPIQYADYAAWQREWAQGENFQKQLAYWKQHLDGNPSAVELPTDRPRSRSSSQSGAICHKALDKDLSHQLKTLADREGATLFMLLLAAFKALLFRYTQQTDLIVGSPVAGRTQVETEELIGFFVNTLPLRTRLSPGMTFRELLAAVRETALAGWSNQEIPFESVVEALKPERIGQGTPYINVMFQVQTVPAMAPAWPGLITRFLDPASGPAKFDLLLTFFQEAGQLFAAAEYNPDLFDARTMEALLEHCQVLLQGIVQDPDTTISELPLLSPAEKHQLIAEWNNTRTDYPRTCCVHHLFEEHATGSATALEFRKTRLGYQELNAQANQVAHRLVALGVKPGDSVPLFAERSCEMVVALLAILKAGAAYAPIDPSLPEERVSVLLEELRPVVMVATHARFWKSIDSAARAKTIALDCDAALLRRESTRNPGIAVAPGSNAYISFTSGSTGRPKGVCVPHQAIVRLVKGTDYIRFGPEQVFLQLAPLAFDASTLEIWGALLNGGRLAIMPPEIPSLSDIAEAIRRHEVTTAWFTSGLFNQIVDEDPGCLARLQQVLTGGDVLSPVHVKKALAAMPSGQLFNGYGPTENATFTTCYRIPKSFDGQSPVPIGRPIRNTTCCVLDEQRQPVPIGVAGELYTGGDGLANGYLNSPDLTAQKFVAHPFQAGQRLYRTGDKVRYTADGILHFLGRITEEFKIRGFRVNPGEIESVLLAHPGVDRCAVAAQPDAAGTRQLVCFYVAKQEPIPDPQELQALLRRTLPDYMVPSLVRTLPELPLSANGKVDRNALPRLQPAVSTSNTIAPRNEIERDLQPIWESVLNVRPIGVHDKFFALGGHSLLAVRLLAHVERRFGKKLKVADLFQNPTIATLAALLRGHAQAGTGSALIGIQPDGFKPPLFLVHGAGGGMFWGYVNLARHLGPDQPLFAFKSRGLEGADEPGTIEELAEAYLRELQGFQPAGPYRLGGYCFGGVVAYEMARRLLEQGETVSLLALINSTAPNSSYNEFDWRPGKAFRFATNVLSRAYYTLRLHPERLTQFLSWKSRSFAKRLGGTKPALDAKLRRSPDDWVDFSEFSRAERRVWPKHLRALAAYHPRPYDGPVTLLRSPVHLLRCSFAPDYGWADLAPGRVQVHVIPGAHETIMEEPGVRALGLALSNLLNNRL